MKEVFKPDKTLNTEAMGPYSFYYLLRIAFGHYHSWIDDFQSEYPEHEPYIMDLCEPDSKGLIEKYHSEVGYTEHELSAEEINQF